MQLKAKVRTSGQYVNTASISGAQPDPVQSNNIALAGVSPRPTSDLALNMVVSNTTPIVGSAFTLSVTVTNNGPNTSQNTYVQFHFPPALQIISFSEGVGSYHHGGWIIGSMDAGVQHALNIVCKAMTGSTLHLYSYAYNVNGDHNMNNNSVQLQISPISAIDLEVIKTVNNTHPDIGSNVFFTIRVKNLGNMTATNVVVEDVLPNGYQLVNAILTGGNWSAPYWTITSLLPGTTQQLILTAKVLPNGHYHNTAKASGSEYDPFPSNNTATVEVYVVPLNGPVANADVATGIKNQPITIDVLANDSPGDSPLNPSSVQIVAGTEPNPVTEGIFAINPDNGLVTFTPVSGYTGTLVAHYAVQDMYGLASQAQLTVHIIEPMQNFYPATGPGTLAFEDLWPAKGDYDFNDMVIDYQFEIVGNTNNKVEQLIGTFTLKAFGASFENGFGFQLMGSLSPNDILSVNGYELTENFVNLNSNGVEAGQSKPTFILFDNAFTQMSHPGIGIGVNTTPNAPYVAPKTFVLTIIFKPDEVAINDLNIGNFNPFIIVNKVRGHEVHLPYYPPTDLVNPALFGQDDDSSNASTNRWYVTANNLPWAINIYESFDYPIEKQDILGVYLKFAEWAMSGGVQFPDWYKNLLGYRNSSLIYQKPQGK